LARYLDPATVVLDDPVTNRKAQSQTAFLFGSEKRLEKLRQVIIFDSKPVSVTLMDTSSDTFLVSIVNLPPSGIASLELR
jgi:hypothetical protein